MLRLPIHLTRAERRRFEELIRLYDTAGRTRKAKRFRAVLAFADGDSLHDICRLTEAPLPSVQRWLTQFRRCGGHLDAFEPQSPPGWPCGLTANDLVTLTKTIAAGPERAGYDRGVWTGPLVADLIVRKYEVNYTRTHVTRLLHQLGFSCQKPRKHLAKAKPEEQRIWLQERWPRLKKTPRGETPRSTSKTKLDSASRERRSERGLRAAKGSSSNPRPGATASKRSGRSSTQSIRGSSTASRKR